MNKFLVLGVVSTTLLVVLWPTMTAGQADDPMANFVRFPNSKIKRAMEMEEFFKDGDRVGARKRALDRQRRANQESTPENVKRARRSLLEAEDEEDSAPCRAHEMNRVKRGTPQQTKAFIFSNDYGIECSAETQQRFRDAMTTLAEGGCYFEDFDSTIHDLFLNITCDGTLGNFAAIGFITSTHNYLNVVESNGKAAVTTVSHELIHTCGLFHVHQESGSESWIAINDDCVQVDYLAQFSQASTYYQTDIGLIMSQSIMMYIATAFITADGNCDETITSLKPDVIPSDTFASFKVVSWIEMQKFNLIFGDDSNSDTGIEGGQVQAVNDLFEYAPVGMTITVLDLMASFFETVTDTIYAGESQKIECPGSNFQITAVVWSEFKASARCRKANCKILDTSRPGFLPMLGFFCDSGSAPGSELDFSGSSLIIDASFASVGQVQVEYHCS